MGFNFKGCDRGQGFLMPPNIRDWIPEGDLVWFVIDAVEGMDLSSFYARYRPDGWGNAAYDPAMMVSLLIYAYCLGERSSRKIERLCERDIAFRVICANHVPDHATIARFRQNNERGLEKLFCEVLRLCAEAGLLKVGLLALDGTKIRARASLEANRTYDYLREEVRGWLVEAEETDASEDRLWGTDGRGDELPPELRRSEDRRRRIKECWSVLTGKPARRRKKGGGGWASARRRRGGRGRRSAGASPSPPRRSGPRKRGRSRPTSPTPTAGS